MTLPRSRAGGARAGPEPHRPRCGRAPLVELPAAPRTSRNFRSSLRPPGPAATPPSPPHPLRAAGWQPAPQEQPPPPARPHSTLTEAFNELGEDARVALHQAPLSGAAARRHGSGCEAEPRRPFPGRTRTTERRGGRRKRISSGHEGDWIRGSCGRRRHRPSRGRAAPLPGDALRGC